MPKRFGGFGPAMAGPKNVLIMGAAGRDFFNFLVRYKDDPNVRVRGFTATQIPGIPIFPEEDLPSLIVRFDIDEVVFSYSDVDYNYILHRASIANALGADFVLLGTRRPMPLANVPAVAVTAGRP